MGENMDNSNKCINDVIAVSYQDLELQSKKSKVNLVFNEGQARIIQAGYDRHPLSAEAFSLICAYYDDQKSDRKSLTPEQTAIAEDMLSGEGEFFCQAIETKSSKTRITATIYDLVTALPINAADKAAGKYGYDENGIKYSGKKTFDISDLNLQANNEFSKIYANHDDLIEYLTSRKYADLPEQIQTSGEIVLPCPGNVWPMGLVFGDVYYFLSQGVSRGVRPCVKRAVKLKGRNKKK